MVWTPSVVIGIGGSGKWMLTHLKKRLCDVNRGQPPPEIGILALDVDSGETGQPIPWVPDFKDGKQVEFKLNYQQGSPEWLHFSGLWAQGMANRHHYDSLKSWLHPDDVTKQHLSPQQLTTTGGAAQDRQRSRTSLHLKIRDLHGAIRQTMQRVNAHRQGRRVPIFIVAGLAGGTGSGTFMDIATLAIQIASSPGMFGENFQVIGIFFLPAAFEPVLSSDEERTQSPVNTFAALRELERYLQAKVGTIVYDQPVGEINVHAAILGRSAEAMGGRTRPCDIIYLVDGTRYAEARAVEPITHVAPWYGVFPAVADFLFAHVHGTRGIDYSNLAADAGKQGAFYSACGSYSLIFDVDDVIRTLAHPLALAVLDHFLVSGHIPAEKIAEEVKDFLQRAVDAPFNTPLNQKLDDTRARGRWDRRLLKDTVALGKDEHNKNRDKPLPAVDFQKEAQAFDWRDAADLKRLATRAEERRKECIEKTAELVEYYKAQHKSIFWKYIEERLIEERRKRTVQEDGRTREEEEIKPGLLKEDMGRGCLWHAQRFLEILGELYDLTAQNLTGWITARDYPRQIAGAQLAVNTWQTQMTEVTFFERVFGSGNDVRGFCDTLSRLLELEQEQMLAQAAKEIFEALRDVCADLVDDIEVWRSTFEAGKRAIVSGLAELAAYRREKAKVIVRRYVTDPPNVNKDTGEIKLDEIEQKLFEKYFGRHQTDYEEKVLKQFGWRIDPPGRYFPSDPAEWQARRHLRSTLPAEFLPWDELSKDPLRWNYQFAQNLLQIGFFRGLKEEVDIFDVVHMKEEGAADLANSLVNQSTPLLSFSATAQRSQGVEPTEANWFRLWGAFGKATGASVALAKDLDAKLKGQKGQPQTLPDLRHEISAIQARHLFVVEAIPQFEDFKREYRKKQRESFRARRAEDAAAQPHVFLEERNAASLEIDFTEVPHTGPAELRQSHEPLLEPAVVCCLADERFLLNVALALWQGWLTVRPNPATGQVEHVYVMAGGREIVVGGKNPFDALVNFHTDTNVDVSDARRDLQERAAGLRSDKRQQGNQAFEDFIKDMEQGAGQPLLSKGILDAHPEARQLDQVLRLLLWRDAQKERAYV